MKRVPYQFPALRSTRTEDFIGPYVDELGTIIDMDAIAKARVKIGADPMGGSNLGCWAPIVARYGLDVTVVNPKIDKTFSFMPVDHDGKIRMDCSSPYAMKNLVALKDRFDIAFGNDTDSDRHGIVTRSAGLMNPNHYLAVAIEYLFTRRKRWRPDAAVGKTLVSSSMIDRVAASLGRTLAEVPVGFKWFVPGLLDGSFGFGGEESAGASFLRMDGSVWTTDKDGILLDLLAAEILATTGKDPGEHYARLTRGPAARPRTPGSTRRRRGARRSCSGRSHAERGESARCLAGEQDPGEDAARALRSARRLRGAEGLHDGSGLVRGAAPQGPRTSTRSTRESFKGADHLAKIVEEAQQIVGKASRCSGNRASLYCSRAHHGQALSRPPSSAAAGYGGAEAGAAPARPSRGRGSCGSRRSTSSASRCRRSIPNLEGHARDLKFEGMSSAEAARGMDVVLLGLPHKVSAHKAPEIMQTGAPASWTCRATFGSAIRPSIARYYGAEHPCPDGADEGHVRLRGLPR